MDLKAIGRRIKIAREQKGLTQEALAELVDLTPMHISVIERGFKPTKLETFCRIANVLGVSADTLLQDVIDCSANSVPSELDTLLKDLPAKERRKIYIASKLISMPITKMAKPASKQSKDCLLVFFSHNSTDFDKPLSLL